MEKLTAPIQISPNKMERLVSKKVTQGQKSKQLEKRKKNSQPLPKTAEKQKT